MENALKNGILDRHFWCNLWRNPSKNHCKDSAGRIPREITGEGSARLSGEIVEGISGGLWREILGVVEWSSTEADLENTVLHKRIPWEIYGKIHEECLEIWSNLRKNSWRNLWLNLSKNIWRHYSTNSLGISEWMSDGILKRIPRVIHQRILGDINERISLLF